MRYRMLDSDGDYSFGRGQQNITYGTYAVAQAIKTRLMLLQGEWWEDTEEGLPLFQQIVGHTGSEKNKDIVDSLIKERIINTPNVLNISNFTSTFDSKTRTYSFQSKVKTAFGDVVVAKTF